MICVIEFVSFFFFKQKTAYEMRISDWSSDVCSSDLPAILTNTARVEAWPGGLLRARGNHDARLLAGADHVFRRKRDGRYLAIERGGELLPLRQNGRASCMERVCQYV